MARPIWGKELPSFDPDYVGQKVFDRCFEKRAYRANEIYENTPESPVPCIPPLTAIPVSLDGGNINISGLTVQSSFTFENYYYTNRTGAALYDTGERLTRAFNTDGATITEYWFDENDALGTAPNALDIVPDGVPYPIETVNITLNELPSVLSLSPTALNTSIALIQVKSSDTLLTNSYTSTADSIKTQDLVRWRLDGIAPTLTTGMFAGHGTVIKLDSNRQITSFRAIATTDSVAYGSDIRPSLAITYFVGLDKK